MASTLKLSLIFAAIVFVAVISAIGVNATPQGGVDEARDENEVGTTFDDDEDNDDNRSPASVVAPSSSEEYYEQQYDQVPIL